MQGVGEPLGPAAAHPDQVDVVKVGEITAHEGQPLAVRREDRPEVAPREGNRVGQRAGLAGRKTAQEHLEGPARALGRAVGKQGPSGDQSMPRGRASLATTFRGEPPMAGNGVDAYFAASDEPVGDLRAVR